MCPEEGRAVLNPASQGGFRSLSAVVRQRLAVSSSTAPRPPDHRTVSLGRPPAMLEFIFDTTRRSGQHDCWTPQAPPPRPAAQISPRQRAQKEREPDRFECTDNRG